MNGASSLSNLPQQLALFEQDAPWFFPTLVFVVGACVGSFLNVCIYRIPVGGSVVSPGSQCSCGKPIAWYDNIPILSWFILRGRARCCGNRFSIRYPAVEGLTAVLFFLCWYLLEPIPALGGMIFGSMMIAAGFIDIDHMIIPDRFSTGGFISGMVFSSTFPSLHGFSGDLFVADSLRSLITSIEGAFIGSALVLWTALLAELVLKKEAMGFGDVKLMGAIGVFCGWQGAVFALFGGAVIGSAGVLLYSPFHLLRNRGSLERSDSKEVGSFNDESVNEELEKEKDRRREGEESTQLIGRHVPFGPMLAAAGLIYFLFLHDVVDKYFGEAAAVLFWN